MTVPAHEERPPRGPLFERRSTREVERTRIRCPFMTPEVWGGATEKSIVGLRSRPTIGRRGRVLLYL